MTAKHISSAFDRDLEGAQTKLMNMAALVQEAMIRAADALETGNPDLARTVRRSDRAIDDLEESIKMDCARIVATRSPNAGDLRTVLTIISIAATLERCGDYAKNIAKRTLVLADAPPVAGISPGLRRMQQAVASMMTDALDAYSRRDVQSAEEIRARDREVDEMYTRVFRSLLTHMMAQPDRITTCMHLHFIAKNIERMGDHTTSIAEQVIYLVTGALPDDDRPKGDLTALSPSLPPCDPD